MTKQTTRFVVSVLVAIGLGACGDVVKGSAVDAPPDPCPGAICECTAATEAMDCGAHQICDESGGNRECKCAAAYNGGGDGACVFGGGFADPGMQDPTKWTAVGTGPMVIPAATGNKQAGEMAFDKTAICNLATMKQTFTMPPFERADPLKVTVTSTVLDPNGDFSVNQNMTIAVGGQQIEFTALRGQYKTQSFCLGPAAFGGPVEIRIGNASTTSCAPVSMGSIRIDELKLEVAGNGECPRTPGVVNGNFQLATGWLFPNSSSGAGQILPNIGENGSFAAQLQQPNRCSEVSATGQILIPAVAQVAHPALDVYWNGSSGSRLNVSIAGRGIGSMNANGVIKRSRVCIPKWAVGNVASIGFTAPRVSNNACGTALNRTFILDNMTIVDEPACGALADITDPSFEKVVNPMGPMPGWGLTNGLVNDVEGSRAFVINQASNAASGSGVLRTSNSNPCVSIGEGGADFSGIVPAPSGTAGPAIKFNAKADAANVNSEARMQLLSFGGEKSVIENGAYNPAVLCIPPALAGRLITARASTGDPDGGGCFPPTAYEELTFWDDISLTTDPSCPAQ